MKENAANNILPGQFIRPNAVLFQEFNAVLIWSEFMAKKTKFLTALCLMGIGAAALWGTQFAKNTRSTIVSR